ncbi:PREDICTED: trypsin-1-like [Nicrophorus vespilloides]|uniref:CLIP domain-containing serine protease n=1 Tax=Nicrophorus vespilloides TaxID=110193 RepID=A0ABM1NFX7_NICVS|nr:PREDICTED: trypsin-1-like [Nicrophorus vespilloides]
MKQIIYLLLMCSVSCVLAQKPTDSCKTPNGETAKCISIFSCPNLYKAGKSSNPDVIQFVQDSICRKSSFNVFVCCGSDAAYKKKAPVVLNEHDCSNLNVDFKKLWENGMSLDTSPSMALLEYESLLTGERSFRCKGSIIGKRHVLTPTHCVTGSYIKDYKLVNIRLGEWNISTSRDCIKFGNEMVCSNPGLNVGFERVTAYKDDPKYNDISLIKLNRNITYSKTVSPICFPTQQKQLTVPGWGLTENGVQSDVKLKVQVPIINNKDCCKKVGKLFEVRNTQICAGGELGKDSCKGDSGGPLMHRDIENDQWTMEGIVSLGIGCGREGWPGIYTNVRSYISWIKEHAI